MIERRLVDISQTLRVGLPSWPGDTRAMSEPIPVHAPGCPVNLFPQPASSQAGAPADAPLHDDPDGGAIDAVPSGPRLGPDQLPDLRRTGPGRLHAAPARAVLRPFS